MNKNADLKLVLDPEKREDASSSGLFHPTRILHIRKEDLILGGVAEVHRRVLDKLGIKERVAVFEIGLNKLLR